MEDIYILVRLFVGHKKVSHDFSFTLIFFILFSLFGPHSTSHNCCASIVRLLTEEAVCVSFQSAVERLLQYESVLLEKFLFKFAAQR